MVKSKLGPTTSASSSSSSASPSLSTATAQSTVSNGERKPSAALLEAKRRARNMLKSQTSGASAAMQESVIDIFQNVSIDGYKRISVIFNLFSLLLSSGCQCQEHETRSHSAHL